MSACAVPVSPRNDRRPHTALRARANALARRAGEWLRDLGRYDPATGRVHRALPEEHWKADQHETNAIRSPSGCEVGAPPTVRGPIFALAAGLSLSVNTEELTTD